MDIRCYSCGLVLADGMAIVEIETPVLRNLSRVPGPARACEPLLGTVFEQLPSKSFCTYCLAAIVDFPELFEESTVVPHSRFDLRVTVRGHSTAADWAVCRDCGAMLREPCRGTPSQLPPDVRLKRRMLLHCAAVTDGLSVRTRALAQLLDHRDPL